jgi:hypothetical protein
VRALLAAGLFGVATLAVAGEEVITIPTREGVSVSYLLVTGSETPRAVAISFVGSEGAINLRQRADGTGVRFGPGANFLIRIRDRLAADGVAGMPDTFRAGPEHSTDIRAVIADLKRRYAGFRPYLVGTSRGAVSAARLGVALDNEVSGVVLTSTVTRADRRGANLSAFDFGSLKVPLLMIHHVDDGCPSSPYRNVRDLGSHHTLVSVSGGDMPHSGPCEPQSAHGYLGREAEVAQVIAQWMLGHEVPRQIQ